MKNTLEQQILRTQVKQADEDLYLRGWRELRDVVTGAADSSYAALVALVRHH